MSASAAPDGELLGKRNVYLNPNGHGTHLSLLQYCPSNTTSIVGAHAFLSLLQVTSDRLSRRPFPHFFAPHRSNDGYCESNLHTKL